MKSIVYDTIPSPEEVRAAMQRAHQERNAAIRHFLARLFTRRKTPSQEHRHQPALYVVAGH
jgi:hypothetical protein